MSDPSPSVPWWDRRHAPGGWRVPDAGLALAFLVVCLTEIVPNPDMTPHAPLVALAFPLTLPLTWRASYPATMAVVVSTAHLVMSLVSTGPFSPQLAVLPVLVALYSAGSGTRGARSVVTGALTLALTVTAWAVVEEGDADDFWPYMLWAGAWATGTFVRRRSELAERHARRAALLEVEAREVAAESAQQERDRIARELHDVVAHSVSLMVIQAGAERLQLGPDSPRTVDALEAIEEAGRTALAELRTMLGVLRDQTGQELAPLPGLAEIPALVDRVRAAGLPVELTTRPDGLVGSGRHEHRDQATGLAAYRIVQEALTNVVRHVGAVPTRVVLDRADGWLRIDVHNDAPALPRANGSVPPGRGLSGMRERAVALGGSFDSGQAPDGGFRVVASLPVGAGVRR